MIRSTGSSGHRDPSRLGLTFETWAEGCADSSPACAIDSIDVPTSCENRRTEERRACSHLVIITRHCYSTLVINILHCSAPWPNHLDTLTHLGSLPPSRSAWAVLRAWGSAPTVPTSHPPFANQTQLLLACQSHTAAAWDLPEEATLHTVPKPHAFPLARVHRFVPQCHGLLAACHQRDIDAAGVQMRACRRSK
eukprot:SAG31_NODE_6546_length_1981_cov_2.579171_2_plen_194_part_00